MQRLNHFLNIDPSPKKLFLIFFPEFWFDLKADDVLSFLA